MDFALYEEDFLAAGGQLSNSTEACLSVEKVLKILMELSLLPESTKVSQLRDEVLEWSQ